MKGSRGRGAEENRGGKKAEEWVSQIPYIRPQITA
jgi:hypothetical protein